MTTTPTVWQALQRANTTDEPEALANVAATNTQSHSKIVALDGGGYLVAWEDSSTKYAGGLEPRDIVGQIFDVFGNKAGAETYLSGLYGDLDQQAEAVIALPGGGFASAYQTTDAAMAGDLENVTVQVYDNTGTVFRFDDFREGFNAASVHNDTRPAIAGFPDGSYALVFENDEAGNRDLTFYAVSSAGVISSPVTVAGSSANESAPDTARLSSGDVVISYDVDNAASEAAFTIRTKTGAFVASGDADKGNAAAASETSVAANTSGHFLVAWTGTDASGAGIHASIFTDAGAEATAGFLVNTATAGDQNHSAVTALADQGFLIAWNDVASHSVKGQRLDETGQKIGSEFTVAALNYVSDVDLTLLADGRVAATVTDDKAGNKDVYHVILDPRTAVEGTAGADILTSRIDGSTVYGFAGDDQLYGFDGDDSFDGGAGADTLAGGKGNDFYNIDAGDTVVEGANGGIDRIQASFSIDLRNYHNVENAVLRGRSTISLTGDDRSNILDGERNAGANVLTGLKGHDTYSVGAGDTIVEGANGGIDTVQSTSINVNLANYANVENIVLRGGATISATGDDNANRIDGSLNLAANKLTGLGGDDIYTVGAGDTIVEAANGGTDRVYSSLTGLDLRDFANVEYAILTGTKALDATGDDLANTLGGNSAANVLSGLGGNDRISGGGGGDTLIGGMGRDVLDGGAGNDTFVFTSVDDSPARFGDLITDFAAGDKIDVSAIAPGGASSDFVLDMLGDNSLATGHIRQTLSGTTLTLEFNTDADAQSEMRIILQNHATALTNADFIL